MLDPNDNPRFIGDAFPRSWAGYLWRWSLSALVAGGLIATAVAFLGDWNWYADLFSHLRPQYLVVFGLAAACAAAGRRWVTFGLAITGLSANLIAVAPHALPLARGDAPFSTGRPWTFVSLNLLHGNQDVAAVLNYLRSQPADVVILQEVSERWATSLERLDDLYPHRFTHPRKDGFGLALFSREKPLEISFELVGDRRPTDLVVLAEFARDGRRISVAGVHADKPDKEWKTLTRRAYLDDVRNWAAAKAGADEPVLVIGDFNTTPWSTSFRRFEKESQLLDTSRGTIFEASWNVWRPDRLLIDHAFISRHWQLLRREIGPDVGSDHRPLMIQAVLRP